MCNERPEDPIMYKAVPGLPTRLVGSDGSYWKPVKLKLRLRKYVRLILRDQDGKRLFNHLHQVVLAAFRGPCPAGLECCHNDGNPHNNELENLRYDTHLSNIQDIAKHGTHPNRGRNPRRKITDEQVPEIRHLYRSGLTLVEIAKRHNVTKATISLIIRGDSYAHIPDPYRTTMRTRGCRRKKNLGVDRG